MSALHKIKTKPIKRKKRKGSAMRKATLKLVKDAVTKTKTAVNKIKVAKARRAMSKGAMIKMKELTAPPEVVVVASQRILAKDLKQISGTAVLKCITPPYAEDSEHIKVRGQPAFHNRDKFVFTMASVYTNDVYVWEFSEKLKLVRSIRVHPEFEFETIVGAEADKMLALYGEHIINNLPGNLIHPVYQIGSDPEIFVEDRKTKQVIPAFDFLSSKKDGKTKTAGAGPRGAHPLYWDGFQAEFETQAVSCLGWHVDSIQLGLKGCLAEAKKHNKNAILSSQTLMEIPPEMLAKASEEHVQFGCMPSFNIYDLSAPREDGRRVPFRSAGGHLHFDFNLSGSLMKMDRVTRIVKALDAILGVCCVSLFEGYDDPRRRELYGLPGEFRLPKYGIEYRVLSNAWMFHPTLTNLTFDFARKVVAFGDQGLLPYWKGNEAETIRIIKECDVAAARKVMETNKHIIVALFRCAYGLDEMATAAYNVFFKGMDASLTNPKDIAGNWKLEDTWTTHSDGPEKNWRLSYTKIQEGKKVA